MSGVWRILPENTKPVLIWPCLCLHPHGPQCSTNAWGLAGLMRCSLSLCPAGPSAQNTLHLLRCCPSPTSSQNPSLTPSLAVLWMPRAPMPFTWYHDCLSLYLSASFRTETYSLSFKKTIHHFSIQFNQHLHPLSASSSPLKEPGAHEQSLPAPPSAPASGNHSSFYVQIYWGCFFYLYITNSYEKGKNIQSALSITGFWILRFNQPLIENICGEKRLQSSKKQSLSFPCT